MFIFHLVRSKGITTDEAFLSIKCGRQQIAFLQRFSLEHAVENDIKIAMRVVAFHVQSSFAT